MSKNKTIEEIAKEDEEFLATWGESPQEEEKEEFISKFLSEYILREDQIPKQVNKITNFLKLIKPHLAEDYYTEGATELRPVKRDKEDKKFIRSFNTFHLLDKDIIELHKFLENINGHGFCLYYSVFDFDRTLEIENKKNKYTITNDAALYTTILPMDLDNCTEAEYMRIKGILEGLGIETVDVYTGHGYQMIILLDSKIYDKQILRKFTTLIRSKGIDADEAIADAARVMRLPYTFNCKTFDKKSKYYDQGIIPVQLISSTQNRYKIYDIFRKLNTLPDIIKRTSQEEEETNEIALNSIKTKPLTEDVVKPKVDIKSVQNIEVTSLKTLYHMINFEALPEAIQKLLNGSQQGLRNKAILFLIPFLRNSMGLNIQTIRQVMCVWGSRCNPILEESFILKEVDRIYQYGLKGPYGKYDQELAKAYGYIEFNTFTRQNKVIIPNEVFEDFDIVSDGSIRIYLAMQLYKHLDNKTEFTQKEIEKVANISRRTFFRNIPDLLKLGYVCKRRGTKKKGEEYIYYINPYFNSTTGFTLIETATIKLMLNELTDGEMKLYSYLAYMIGNTKGTCWSGQKYLAKKIGKAGHDSISKMTDSMHNKKFITKTTTKEQFVSHTTYNLNY